MSAEWEKAEQLQVRFTSKVPSFFQIGVLFPPLYDLIHLTSDLAGVGHHSDGRVQGVPARRAAQDPRHPVARRRAARRLHRPSHEGDRHAATLHFIC